MQHDESKLPSMIKNLKKEKLDIVIGSRFTKGSIVRDFSSLRLLASKLSNYLARIITGVRLTDPMSGFFIMKRSAFDSAAQNLSGLGFKILLDIFASSKNSLKYKEIDYVFRKRNSGISKLDSLVIWEYLLLLWETRLGFIIPARFISFCFIGSIGLGVHLLCLFILRNLTDSFIIAQFLSTFTAMTSNFFLNNLLTYRDVRHKGVNIIKGLIIFYLTCGIGVLANVGLANSLFTGIIPGTEGFWYLSGIFGAFVGVVWNFLMSTLITWKVK